MPLFFDSPRGPNQTFHFLPLWICLSPFLSVYIDVCLSVSLFRLSIHASLFDSECLLVSVPHCLLVRLSVSLSVFAPIRFLGFLSICL